MIKIELNKKNDLYQIQTTGTYSEILAELSQATEDIIQALSDNSMIPINLLKNAFCKSLFNLTDELV